MVALNYQTGDKPMQINQAKFLDNGKCGFLLRPQFMFKDEYLPSDPGAPGIANVAALDLTVRVMAARHLLKPKVVQDNGFNPVWDESFNLRILNPDLALIRFCVYDEDMFGDPNFLGAATLPALCLLSGYRSLQLKNGHSEELELSSLLLQIIAKQVDTASSLAVMLSRAEVNSTSPESTM